MVDLSRKYENTPPAEQIWRIIHGAEQRCPLFGEGKVLEGEQACLCPALQQGWIGCWGFYWSAGRVRRCRRPVRTRVGSFGEV